MDFTELFLIFQAILVSILVLLLCLYGCYFLSRPKNLPPGPLGYPLIGSTRELSEHVSKDFTRLGKKYGDIFCLWLGGDKYIVVLNSYDVIKEAFSTRGAEFSDRIPQKTLGGLDIVEPVFNAHYNDGHRECKKVVANSIRHLMSTRLENVLRAEMCKIAEFIDEEEGNPMNVCSLMELVMTNVFCAWHFNKTYELDHPELKKIASEILKYFVALESSLTCIYSGKTIFSTPPCPVSGKESCRWYYKFIDHQIDSHISTSDAEQNPDHDLIDDLLMNDLLQKHGRENIIYLIMMLITDAASQSFNWLIVYYIQHPDYQAFILEEIQALNLDNGHVSLEDKRHMPYTEAFMMEVERMSTIFQLTSPRTPTRDTMLRGYNIRHGFIMVANIEGLHKNSSLFPEPEVFKPERFIKDGKLCSSPGFMPFGIGRRMCMGEQMVKSCMFYLFVNMVHKFDIHKLSSEAETKHSPGSLHSKMILRVEDFKVVMTRKMEE